MRFHSRFFSRKSSRNNVSHSDSASHPRLSRFEKLESRDLLSLSPSSADYKALVAANSFGSSEENAIWVTSISDTVSTTDGKITLREALDYAGQSLAAGEVSSTIRFSVGGTITLSATRQSLKASKSVTIDASDVGGIKIKAQRTLALYVYGGTSSSSVSVTLNNVVVTGGSVSPASSSPAKGAAIQVAANCNLTLNNCSVKGNTSTSALGVGVYMTSGTLTLNDVVFSENTSTGSVSMGGAVYVESGSLNATNVVFRGNSAAEGGAIYVKNGTTFLTNCFFEENAATNGNGGALSSSSATTLKNVSFLSNSSTQRGGALFITGDAESTFTDVSFTNNSALNGGAVFQDGQSLKTTGAKFANNASVEKGGAVYIQTNALMLAEDALFYGNLASDDGGALFNSGSFYLTTGKMEENSSGANGGAVSSSGYVEIRDAAFKTNAAGVYGGSFYLNGSQRSWLLRTVVTDSTANEGGGIFNSGLLTIVDSTISSNVASASGGGLSNSGSVLISTTRVSDNIASGANAMGGGVLNYVNATLNVSDSSLLGNVSESGSGGAVANNGTATLDIAVVSDNMSALFGGAVYNSGTLTSQYSTFSSNEASDGGAIADVYGSSSTFVGSTFWGNVASNYGGALYSYGSTVFRSSTIAYNVASNAGVAAYYSPEEAGSVPSFDSSTTVESNLAASEVTRLPEIETLAVLDAVTGEAVNDALLFNGIPVNGLTRSRTLTITNTSSVNLKFSNFKELGDVEPTVLSYALYDSSGELINASSNFVLAAGDSITLNVAISPKSIGSKYFEFSWTTSELNSADSVISGTAKEFVVRGSAEISKVASSSTSVETLDNSTFNVSMNANGSFNINLSKAPESNVILYFGKSSDAVMLSTDVLLFTTSNYNVPQTVTVSIDQDKLSEAGLPTKIFVYPQLLAMESNYRGSTFAEVALDVADYVVFQDDCSVNIDSYATAGVSRWDLTGDGVIDLITYGGEDWINSSSVSGNTINYKRTKNGTTTTTEIDVVYQSSAPTAFADVSTLPSLPGFVRIALESASGAISNWRVDWGDGSPLSVIDSLSTKANFAHSYASDGTYTISIELVDSNGVGTGVWTSLAPQKITGVSTTSSIIDVTTELFIEDAQLDATVETISGAILAELEQEKLKR